MGKWRNRNTFLSVHTMLLLSVVVAVSLCIPSTAIVTGDEVEWQRHGYIVKVLARDPTVPASSRACTGIIVSQGLVITPSKCVMDKQKRLEDIVIVIPRIGRDAVSKRTGTLLEVSDTKAAIRIVPLSLKELCPIGAAPKRVAILPMRPSLTRPSMVEMYMEDYTDKCRITGFETGKESGKFISNKKMLQFEIGPYPQVTNNVVVVPVTNHTACFEDAGAPLECLITETNTYVQVGLLSVVEVPKNANNCSDAIAMYFVPLWDEETMKLLENNDFAGVVHAYQTCRLSAGIE